ncbi:ABC transporter permease [Candidatus Woesearchaeota archaeon]|nr:ABC transporter permease [Candidatus Woesearchaeota archaeon]
MNLKDMFKIAIGNLTHRRVRSWLTLIGIFAGIAAIVALISLGQGLEGAVTEQFASLGVDVLSIQGAGNSFGPPGATSVGKVTDHDISLLKRINGVKTVFGRQLMPALVEYRGNSEALFLASIPSKEGVAVIRDIMDFDLEEGYLISGTDKGKITIGSKVEIDGLKPEVGSKVTIGGKEFEVVGILKKKGNFMIDDSILMSEVAMDELFDLNGDYSLLVVAAEADADMVQLKDSVERTLRRDRGQKVGEEDFVVSSPQETIDSFKEILTIVQILLVGIAAISLVVGAIGILNTMYTAVLERRKEIGIMKSIGATNEQVLGIFLIESGMLGLLGGFIGLVLGIMISKGVEIGVKAAYDIAILKAALPWWLLVGALLFSFVIGSLAGTLPAMQASRMDPVESLRK